MSSAQNVEMSVTTDNPFQESFHPNNQITSRFITAPGFKPYPIKNALNAH